MSQRIRIKLQSYDHNLVDKSAEKIVKTVRSTGAVVTGPIPLPTPLKPWRFTTPWKPLPLVVPTTSTSSPSANMSTVNV